MYKTVIQRAFLAAGIALASMASLQAGAQPSIDATTQATPPDSGLFNTYSFSTGYTNVYVSTCGSVPGSDGCYGSGTLGLFGRAGALIEGNAAVNSTTNTVTRYIYIVDQAVNGGTGTALDVYRETEVINAPSATISFQFVKTVGLPLTGGSTAKTYMAADMGGHLYIGTDQSPFAVTVAKAGYAVSQVGGFSPPINVSSITSNKYGYVTVTYGGVSGSDAFYVFGPTGTIVETGGGADLMIGTSVGLTTGNVVATTSAVPASRLHIRFKKPGQ